MKTGRWRAWVAALLIFVVGVGVGVAGSSYVALRRLREIVRAPENTPGRMERAAPRLAAELTRKLELTPEESARVLAALEQSAADLKTLRNRFAHDATEEVRMTLREIGATLPPAKRQELRRLLVERFGKLGVTPPALDDQSEGKE